MADTERLVLSFGLSLLAAALSYRAGALTRGGALAAVLVGTLTAGVGGWEWGMLVILFFVSSSMLSRLGAERKAELADDQWEKGARRDWGQVLANGGLISLLALLWWFWPARSVWGAALGVLATVTGDTWATEIGALSSRQPRLITTWRPAPAGASGAVTPLGTLAMLAGAACIGLAGAGLGSIFQGSWQLDVLPAAMLGGVAGAGCDSVLGATAQRIAWCPVCGTETERIRHRCGAATVPLRGWSWLNNDAVNLVSSAAGGLVAGLVAAR